MEHRGRLEHRAGLAWDCLAFRAGLGRQERLATRPQVANLASRDKAAILGTVELLGHQGPAEHRAIAGHQATRGLLASAGWASLDQQATREPAAIQVPAAWVLVATAASRGLAGAVLEGRGHRAIRDKAGSAGLASAVLQETRELLAIRVPAERVPAATVASAEQVAVGVAGLDRLGPAAIQAIAEPQELQGQAATLATVAIQGHRDLAAWASAVLLGILGKAAIRGHLAPRGQAELLATRDSLGHRGLQAIAAIQALRAILGNQALRAIREQAAFQD